MFQQSSEHIQVPLGIWQLDQIAHYLDMNYYVNFLERLGSNGFQLK